MSLRHPVIAITGSSGAGTTSVTRATQHIFRRENITAAFVEGGSFHRYFCAVPQLRRGRHRPGQEIPAQRGRNRAVRPEARHLRPPWGDIPPGTDLLCYEGLHGSILRRMPDYVHHICPQFSRTFINFQRVPQGNLRPRRTPDSASSACSLGSSEPRSRPGRSMLAGPRATAGGHLRVGS